MKSISHIWKKARLIVPFGLIWMLTILITRADAQLADLYPGFMQLEQPGHLQMTLFGGGFASERYGATEEGFQLEQSITPYIGVFGRAAAYQLYMKEGELSPLNPSAGHSSRLNFGRFQGGVDFTIYPGTEFFLSGGGNAGNAGGSLIEGDFSSWLWPHSRYPLNFSFSALHTFQNAVTSNAIDFQWALASTENWMLLGGAGGAIFGGGFIAGQVEGQGGPDLGVFYRPWGIGLSAQAGYGDAKTYGQLSVYKQIGWTE